MKMLILLTTLLSLNAHALTCDLDVKVPSTEGGRLEKVEAKSSTSISYNGGSYSIDLADIMQMALAECKNLGGQDCQVITDTNRSTLLRKVTFTAIAIGYKTVGGRKLTDSEKARKHKQLYCKKATECINEAINTEDATANYIEKLYMTKEKSNCDEVENFIF